MFFFVLGPGWLWWGIIIGIDKKDMSKMFQDAQKHVIKVKLALVSSPQGKSNALPLDTVLKGYSSVIGLIDFIWLTMMMNCWYKDKLFLILSKKLPGEGIAH